MKWLRWILMLVSLFFLTTCGSDDGMDQNTNDPGNTPGQTDNPVTDSDQDGIPDDSDHCPDTPSGEDVNENGCSLSQLDSDNDGISDELDNCPGTPENEVANEEGCSDSQRKTYLPDDTFEALLIHYGLDDEMNDSVLTKNIDTVTSLYISPSEVEEILPEDLFNFREGEFPINDLTGLEDFVSLEELFIEFVGQDSLSITGFPNLKSLSIYRSDFTELTDITGSETLESCVLFGVRSNTCSISDNTNLTNIDLYAGNPGANPHNAPGNYFENLIIKNNNELQTLPQGDATNFWWNYVTSMEVSDNPNLSILQFSEYSTVTSMIIENCESLESLSLVALGIEDLTLEGVDNLKQLHLNLNEISVLNVSAFPALNDLNLVANDLQAIDVSALNALEIFKISLNPLTCIKVNQEQLDNIPLNWTKDDEDVYSLECN